MRAPRLNNFTHFWTRHFALTMCHPAMFAAVTQAQGVLSRVEAVAPATGQRAADRLFD